MDYPSLVGGMTESEEMFLILAEILDKAGVKATSLCCLMEDRSVIRVSAEEDYSAQPSSIMVEGKVERVTADICVGHRASASVSISTNPLVMYRSIQPCNFKIDLREPGSIPRAIATVRRCFGKPDSLGRHKMSKKCHECEFKPSSRPPLEPKCAECGGSLDGRHKTPLKGMAYDLYFCCDECLNAYYHGTDNGY